MRTLYLIIFLVSIAFSDVIHLALEDACDKVSLLDFATESENETELEIEAKKESKIRCEVGSIALLLAENMPNSAYESVDGTLLNPYREIHNPPPDK